mgnify:CR=1 FL=1
MAIYIGGTGSANDFDDYEEGNFTVNLGGFSSISYHRQFGKYVKIGQLVIINIYLYVYQATGDSNTVSLQNLPFTSTNENAGYVQNGGVIYYQNDTFETTFNSDGRPYLYMASNQDYAIFTNQGGSHIIGNSTALGSGGNNRYIMCGLQYFTAT